LFYCGRRERRESRERRERRGLMDYYGVAGGGCCSALERIYS